MHTGAYCRARKRLPTLMVRTLARSTGQRVMALAPRTWHWRNRPVRLVDGTTVTMPDTPGNQAAYPQSHNQKPGLGFPLCRMVGLVCLGSGALLHAAVSPYQGKGNDEQSLRRSIRWRAATCWWGTLSTPPTFCYVPCVGAQSMRYSNNTARADA